MLCKDGRYILNLNDWVSICKYFNIDSRRVHLTFYRDLTFIEYALIDIHTRANILSFYDHDGMIRIIKDDANGSNSRLFWTALPYEVSINDILCSEPKPPSKEILDIIKSKQRKTSSVAKKVTKAATKVADAINKTASK